MFKFVVYNIIYRRKAALSYNLLAKLGMWKKTKKLICKITNTQLIAAAIKIKETNQCPNIAILVLKQHVQTVAAQAAHLYARCF